MYITSTRATRLVLRWCTTPSRRLPRTPLSHRLRPAVDRQVIRAFAVMDGRRKPCRAQSSSILGLPVSPPAGPAAARQHSPARLSAYDAGRAWSEARPRC